MRYLYFKFVPVAAAFLVLAVAGPHTHAAFVLTLQQVGSNVVATGSGTIDTAALTLSSETELAQSWPNFISGSSLLVAGTTTITTCAFLTGITGPLSIGSGGRNTASSGSGDMVGFETHDYSLYVPQSYVSGASLWDTSTWNGATLASLGITSGTYTYTWGTGPTADSFTVQTVASVPEPSTWAIMAAGLGMMFGFPRRHRL